MIKNLLVTFVLLITLLGNVMAQTRTITGTVSSAEDGQSLLGVNVAVVDSTIGTITDINGAYSIEVPAGAQSLEFSHVGMESQIIAIGNQTVINVALVLSSVALDEVVVTALGIERQEKALGFAAQELEAEVLTAARETNITRYLTGKVAGVQVATTAAGVTGSSSVTIRGYSSLVGSNQPLYVVDGVPIINVHKDASRHGGLGGDQDYGDGVGDINPDDVESVTVLKGPNASALYGSRGANGVILITTKFGKIREGVAVELNSNITFETINLIPTYQNKYATGYEGTNLYGSMVEIDGAFYETMDTWHLDSWGPPLDGRRTIVNPFEYPENKNTRTMVLLPQPNNNVKDFYETGVRNSNTVAISGGSEKTSTRLTFGNVYYTGIVPNHKVTKYNVSLRANSEVTKWLSLDGKFNYINTNGSQRPSMGSGRDNVNRTFATMGRYVPMDWLKEYYEKTGESGRWPGVNYNPYYVVNELINEDYRDRIIGYGSATIRFTDWLSLLGRAGIDLQTEYREKNWPVGAHGPENVKGRLTTETIHYKDINADLLLMANKQLSDNFHGSLTLGASLFTQRRDNQYMDARDLKAPGTYDVSNAQDFRPSQELWQKEMQSVFFNGQLAYKNYLFMDITGRNDWSSALGVDNYSFFYPSVGLSWVFSDAFSMSKNILSFGKVRASWAQVGNDSDPYLTTSGYTSYTAGFRGQGIVSKSGILSLYNLKNELSESWEIGADLRFLQNRLNLDLTYYDGHTTNQILPIDISTTSGYRSVVINAGKISNKGIEAILNLTPIRIANSFRWNITFNYAKNISMVDELAPGIETYRIAEHYPNHIYANQGEPFGDIFGYATKKSPDGRLIVGPSGAYKSESSLSVLGNITPDWIGGLNNTLWFKGFSLNVLIDFVQGGQISSATKWQMTAKGTGIFTEEGRRHRDTDDQGNQLPYIGVLDGVVEIVDADGNVTGYEENTKAVDGQTYWANRAWGFTTDWFVLDGSYISLREVMFSYNFQSSLLNKTPFYGITLSVVGRNLLYIEEHMEDMGISPEAAPNTEAGYAGIESMSIPTTRSWGLNIKLTF